MKFEKKSLRLLVAAATLLGASSAPANMCLQQATNAELLNELSRRLQSGGGDGSCLGGAQATYTCDRYGFGNLEIALVGLTGSEMKVQVPVRDAQRCARQRDVLSQFRSRITQLAVIGVCDSNGDLWRFSLTPYGIKRISEIIIRDVETCLQQADAMNRN